MHHDLDTLLTAVYVFVDQGLHTQPPNARIGRPPTVSDSEVLSLFLFGQAQGMSERHVLRYADAHLRPWFPTLLSQSSFNRRCRHLAARCALLMQSVLTLLKIDDDPFEVVDGVAIPLALAVRGMRRRCFSAEEADVGYGGVGKRPYYGVLLVLSVSASLPITGFTLAPAPTEERWLLNALLQWRRDPGALPPGIGALRYRQSRHRLKTVTGPTGPILGPLTAGRARTNVYLADRGFEGGRWPTMWRDDLGATVITPDHVLTTAAARRFKTARFCVETVAGQLVDALHLRFPGARSIEGVVTRITAKCTIYNLGIVINRLLNRPDLALKTLFHV